MKLDEVLKASKIAEKITRLTAEIKHLKGIVGKEFELQLITLHYKPIKYIRGYRSPSRTKNISSAMIIEIGQDTILQVFIKHLESKLKKAEWDLKQL